MLLENPTDDSAEVAVAFLKECGLKLTEVTPRGIHGWYCINAHFIYRVPTDRESQGMSGNLNMSGKSGNSKKSHEIL